MPPTDPPMIAPRCGVVVTLFVLLFRAPAAEVAVGDIVCVSVTNVTRTLPSAAVDDDIAVTVLNTGETELEVDEDVVDLTIGLVPPELTDVHWVA